MASPTLPQTAESLEQKFRRLADTWERETRYLSSSTQMVDHPAYREVIALGQVAVPWLLREVERGQPHWDYALRKITGVSPVPASDAGNMPKIAAAWLRWGRENGHRW